MVSIHKDILSFLENEKLSQDLVDRLITSAFIIVNKISFKKNKLIKNLYIKNKTEAEILNNFNQLFINYKQDFSFEVLIKIFEFVISPADKEINGAVYTPENIRKYIIKKTSKNCNKNSKIGDIACGCGAFLFDYAILLNQKFDKPYELIFKENLFGVDITKYSITRTKIILSLLAITKGEDIKSFDFNLFVGNSLDFNWYNNSALIAQNEGFDIIVGNPPYVGSTKIDEKSRMLLKNWSVTSTGKADLYIPFFEIGMHWLSKNGILGYITVNTFYKSVNGRAVRAFFHKNRFDFRLIDFGGEQIFNSRSTYTCICLISKCKGQVGFVKTKSKNIGALNGKQFAKISYENLDIKRGWLLNQKLVEKNIQAIEKSGKKLGELYPIRNGFATLRNKVYLFKPIGRENGHYLLQNKTKIHKIEAAICRDAIKPNVLKNEEEIEELKEKLIFPYFLSPDLFSEDGKELSLLKETIFKKKYRNTYDYLKEHKLELAQRDKGKKKYESWYAYGRNQALNVKGKKLLFPYISNQPYFVYTDDEDLLFYNGYAIVSDSEQDLKILQKILTSSVFWYYIKHTSKPYASDYFALSKNYIKNFGVCELDIEEKKYILETKRQELLNSFFEKKYEINIS